MSEVWQAVALGTLSAGLCWVAQRPRLAVLAWLALVPLDIVVLTKPPLYALIAAGWAGMLCTTPVVVDRTQQRLIRLVAVSSALSWSAAYGLGCWVYQHVATPWAAVLLLTAAGVCALLPLRIAGAPRWVYNPIARTQESCLPVVHIARLGGDLLVSAVLVGVNGAIALLLSAAPPSAAHVGAAASVLIGAALALGYGMQRLRRITRTIDGAERVRMAAVAVNVPPPAESAITGVWAALSPLAGDVAGALARYEQPLQRAAAEGAEIVILPECAVLVDDATRATWLDSLAGWAKRERVAIIAPYVDGSVPSNELAIFDASGELVARYEKQHPAIGLEPRPSARTPPGPHRIRTRHRTLPLSTVICVDLDYADVVRVARKVGGVLHAPSNDWPIFEHMHHRTAVWAAAMSGVSVLRSTGHGISSVRDGAGRVLAAQSSLSGPVVLVVDVPLAAQN